MRPDRLDPGAAHADGRLDPQTSPIRARPLAAGARPGADEPDARAARPATDPDVRLVLRLSPRLGTALLPGAEERAAPGARAGGRGPSLRRPPSRELRR